MNSKSEQSGAAYFSKSAIGLATSASIFWLRVWPKDHSAASSINAMEQTNLVLFIVKAIIRKTFFSVGRKTSQ